MKIYKYIYGAVYLAIYSISVTIYVIYCCGYIVSRLVLASSSSSILYVVLDIISIVKLKKYQNL
jgi:hypothetical protein